MWTSGFRRAGAVSLVAFTLAGCASGVSQRLEEARAALETARAAEAPVRSPEQFQAAERAIQESEALMGNPFRASDAEYQAVLGKAMAACAAATARVKVEVEKAQAETQAIRAQNDRFQAQARAELTRLQAQLRAAEEAARGTRARAERAEAQAAELTRQVAALSPPAPSLAAYVRYVVKPGDTLPRIAARPEIYGDANQWPRLYEANRDVIGRDRKLKVGQVLLVPKP